MLGFIEADERLGNEEPLEQYLSQSTPALVIIVTFSFIRFIILEYNC